MKDPIKLRTVFMGTSHFANDILSALIAAKYNIVGVYTQPDKKSGREKELRKDIVKETAEKNQLLVFQPGKFNPETISELKNIKPDLIIVSSYGKILPAEVLEIPGFGTINTHPSLLPKFRGPSPIQNTLFLGEKETGSTVMLLNEEMDAGDILIQEKISIDMSDDYYTLTQKLTKLSIELLLKTIPLWIEGKIKPQKQDSSQATLCQLIEKGDGKIIWDNEAKDIFNQYRAFLAWPGIFTYWEKNGINQRLKLNKISFMEINPEKELHWGEVFELGDKIGVRAPKGVIILEEVQIEGRKNMPISDFLNGNPEFLGSVLK